MKPFSVSIAPREDLRLFNRIRRVVQRMPSPDLGTDENGKKILLSCHMLARALARFFPVGCQDGYFGGYCDHSWLVTTSGLIIDVYPVAVVGGPILVVTGYSTPWDRLYKKGRLPKSKLNNPRFIKSVDRVAEAVHQTMVRLKIQAPK